MLPRKKASNADTKKQDDINQNVDEYIKDNTLNSIEEKEKNGQAITQEEQDILDKYKESDKENPEEIVNDGPQNELTKAKVKKLIPTKNQFAKAAFANPLFLTFISGATFGLGVICIIETIFN